MTSSINLMQCQTPPHWFTIMKHSIRFAIRLQNSPLRFGTGQRQATLKSPDCLGTASVASSVSQGPSSGSRRASSPAASNGSGLYCKQIHQNAPCHASDHLTRLYLTDSTFRCSTAGSRCRCVTLRAEAWEHSGP